MRTTKILFLLTVTLMLFSQCQKDKVPCERTIPSWCSIVDLSNEYTPVCGCDGKTYQNPGHVIFTGSVTYIKGMCI